MNISMKKISAASVAAIAVLSMSISAFAADYADQSQPSSGGSYSAPVVTENVQQTIQEAVSADGKTTATIEVKTLANLVLSAKTLRTLSQNDSDLVIETKKATVVIAGDSIEKVGKINLSMTISSSGKATVVDFKSSKNFGCEVKVIVKNHKFTKAQLQKLHVFDAKGNDLGAVEIEDGKPAITVTAGGKYTLKVVD